MSNDTFMRRLAEKRAQETQREAQEATSKTPNIDPRFAPYVQDIPDIDDTPHISPEQQALDDFIKMIGIVDAYNRWAQKGYVIVPPGRVDSIKVRCPNPAHPDLNPSAWLNTEKNVYHCGACSQGGDLWDIAAWYFGFPVPGYKADPATFRLLREKIGEDFGMVIEKGIAGDTYLVSTQPTQSVQPTQPVQPAPPIQEQTQSLPVLPPVYSPGPPTQQPTQTLAYVPAGAAYVEELASTDDNAERQYPNIDWRNLVVPDTFLRAYLEATTVDDVPEEFHFWNGLIALGLGVGPYRTLEDSPEVFPNLFVCLVGGTGTGKSKSNRHLISALLRALPHKKDDQPPYGAQYIKGAQSGEILVKCFQHPIVDPSGQEIGMWPGVKGCIHFDELADLIGRTGRLGSTLKTTLMELYDNPHHLRTTSVSHGIVDAPNPFGSVVTTTQFKSIRTLITRADDSSGFANRWVYATGVRKPQFSVNRIRVNLDTAISKLSGLSASARSHELVTWSDDAEKLWDQFYQTILLPYRDSHESSIIQRLDLLLKKLFLLFTINERSIIVSEDTVRRVLSIYPYLTETYGRIDQEISATQEGEENELVMRQILRMTIPATATSPFGRGPTSRDLYNAVKRRITSAGKLRKILENLVVLGLLEEQKLPPGPQGGRPATCYKLAPGVVPTALVTQNVPQNVTQHVPQGIQVQTFGTPQGGIQQ